MKKFLPLVLALICTGFILLFGLGQPSSKSGPPFNKDLAEGMPDWDIAALCNGEGYAERCRLNERAALLSIAGGWSTLPVDYRDNCLKQLSTDLDKSYRLLNQCLEQQALKGLDKAQIDTAATVTAPAAADVPKAASGDAAATSTAGAETGLAVLATSSLADLMAQRQGWGSGASAKEVKSPLAAGAVSPLPQDAASATAADPAGEPIINAFEASPVAKLTALDQGVVTAALAGLLSERESWGQSPWAAATEGLTSLATSSTGDLFAQREAWGLGGPAKAVKAPLAAGAVSPLPIDTASVAAGPAKDPIVNALQEIPVASLTAIPQATLATQLAGLLKTREGWGTEPSKIGDGYAVLATASTSDLFAQREAWGLGGPAKAVKAPLAAGAVSPLPMETAGVAAGPGKDPIVNALQEIPVATLTAIPQKTLATQLAGLLKTREGWGTEPSKTGDGYAVLATASTSDLFAQREAWGLGAPAKAVKAPLAAGAVSPLPKETGGVAAGPGKDPIVNAFEATPVAKLTAIPQKALATQLAGLLKTREGWGTEPSKYFDGYPFLTTASTSDLFAQREAWGLGGSSKTVKAPLAAGAVSPLPMETAGVAAGPAKDPIVNAFKATPVAKLTAIPQKTLAKQLAGLLKTREGWGTEPSKYFDGYPVLATANTSDLFAQREAWGLGGSSKTVKAPLAAGAVSPLPTETAGVAAGPAKDPIVNPFEATPVAKLTAIPQKTLAAQLAALLKTREGWGTEPSKGYAVLATASTSDLFAQREAWGLGDTSKTVKAPLAAGAVSPLPKETGSVASAGPAKDPIVHPFKPTPVAKLTAIPQKALASQLAGLLETREGWGTDPSKGSEGYASLATSSTSDLFTQREAWGHGASAKAVKAPLAAGAVSPLPTESYRLAAGPGKDPIVNPSQEIPAAELTAVPQGDISSALAALLAEREGWGSTAGGSVGSTASEARVAALSTEEPIGSAETCEERFNKVMSEGLITFATASAELDASSKNTLDDLVAVAKACRNFKIEVGGHTDSSGAADFNQRLSESRAKSVADYLAANGIARDKLSAIGYGEAKPKVPNTSARNRALNRRIEFSVE